MIKRLPFLIAVFAITAATLMLQVVGTRLFSVQSWYHLAFFVISMAMFGLTVGAVITFYRWRHVREAELPRILGWSAAGFGISVLAGLLLILALPQRFEIDVMMVVIWGLIAAAVALPFIFSGIIVSLALTRTSLPVGLVYGVDLLGAAAGCFGALGVLNLVDGPTAVLWVAALAAISAPAFLLCGYERSLREVCAACLIAIALGAIALLNGQTSQGLQPLFVKGNPVNAAEIDFERWNSFSQIVLREEAVVEPFFWGEAPNAPAFEPAAQRFMRIDGLAGTPLYRFSGDLAEVDFLRYDVTALAYHAPGLSKGAVIGVGGGRDVLTAKLFGLDEVTGVELNPIFIDILTTNPRFRDYNQVRNLDGVRLLVDEGRSWFARSEEHFDIIQMSLIDTWAATGAGAFTLSENGLYTVEAWDIFLDRLGPEGIFTVSRWYAAGEVNETGRMISLAVGALLDRGVQDPASHIFLAADGRRVATLVLSPDPLSRARIDALEAAAKSYGFPILLSPDTEPASEVLALLVQADSPAALAQAASGHLLDMTPPTDERPFFFNQLKLGQLGAALRFTSTNGEDGVLAGNVIAIVTLLLILGISAVFVAATIVVPLFRAAREAPLSLAAYGTLYFVAIGIGFMMVEIGLMQRMSVYLGHPVYSLSIVLFSIIFATGIGSLISDRLLLDAPHRFTVWCIASVAYIATLGLILPVLFDVFDAVGLVVRAALCIVAILPAGILMGFAFPTGMRLVAAIDEGPTPWFWGINGAAGVLAASLAVIVSIVFGIGITFAIAAVCYVLLIPAAFGLMRLPGRSLYR